jgi:hypothetical protein
MLSNRPTSVSAVVEKFVSPISWDTVKAAVDAFVQDDLAIRDGISTSRTLNEASGAWQHSCTSAMEHKSTSGLQSL